MKRIFAFFLASLLCLCLFACGDREPDEPIVPDDYSGPWLGFQSAFTRADSSQYNNGTLQVKYVGNSVVLFEFDLMEGSEAEDYADTLRISGTLLVGEDGGGVYEGLDADGQMVFTIAFALAGDGQVIDVTHTGEVPMDPDGRYEWVTGSLECSEGTALALLENLPTALTSLNANIGAYTVEYPDEYVLNYFYPVTATLDDTGAVLAQFIVTDDLTAVYRLDTEDGVPALIYGEAQTMLDQVVYLMDDYDDYDGEDSGDGLLWSEAVPLLPVILEGGTLLAPGASAQLVLDAPYAFAVSFSELLSTDDAIAKVGADGKITAVAPGAASITGNIAVDDGSRGFTVELTVGGEGESAEAVAVEESPAG